MIHIKPKGSYYNGFTVEGHANYAEHGRDIVCSAVSVLTQMIAQEIMELQLGRVGSMEGFLDVDIYTPNEYSSSIVHMMMRTLRQIQTQYPFYITIEEENYEETTWI